jgi:hypothetical protein
MIGVKLSTIIAWFATLESHQMTLLLPNHPIPLRNVRSTTNFGTHFVLKPDSLLEDDQGNEYIQIMGEVVQQY